MEMRLYIKKKITEPFPKRMRRNWGMVLTFVTSVAAAKNIASNMEENPGQPFKIASTTPGKSLCSQTDQHHRAFTPHQTWKSQSATILRIFPKKYPYLICWFPYSGGSR
jgi:hypothetical protein